MFHLNMYSTVGIWTFLTLLSGTKISMITAIRICLVNVKSKRFMMNLLLKFKFSLYTMITGSLELDFLTKLVRFLLSVARKTFSKTYVTR